MFSGHSKSSRSKGSSSKGGSKSHSHKSSGSGGSASAQAVRFSFLFVVNELYVNLEPGEGGVRAEPDPWGNVIPPFQVQGYSGETVGTVFRYDSRDEGQVSRAHGYRWIRPGPGERGYVARVSPPAAAMERANVDGGAEQGCLAPNEYSIGAVFSCSPLLPIVVTDDDPSVDERDGFALTTEDEGTYQRRWHVLHFRHPSVDGDPLRGISQVVFGAHGRPYVAGRDASWVPALVPSCYANTRPDGGTPRSRGLGGELAIILGLMGFHGHVGGASDVFARGDWRRGRWHGGNTPLYPHPDDNPRGLLVQVCYDDLENPEGSNQESMAAFEWASIIVKG